MEITEGHIEIAKQEFLKEESIPVVAGKMMNHVGPDAEFSDLIAIANRGKKEATETLNQQVQDEQQTSKSPDWMSQLDTDAAAQQESINVDGFDEKESEKSGSNEILEKPDSTDIEAQRKEVEFENKNNKGSEEPKPSEIKTTVKRNSKAQDSWEA